MNTISRSSKAPTLSAVMGNSQWLDGGAMFGNAPRAVWEKWRTPDAAGRIKLACRAMLIEHEGKRILCETGIGCFFEPELAKRYGVTETEHKLLESLKQLGLTDADIDFVILSHLHFDHAGGLLPSYAEMSQGRETLLFPKARYVVGKAAWERAEKPHARDRASFIPGLLDKLRASGRLIIVQGNSLPGVMEDRLSFRFSLGHTPGQMHTVFKGEKASVVFVGDLVPGTDWVHLPITMGYDRFPEKLIEEKAELYNEAEPEGWWLFYTHDPDIAVSRLGKDSKGRYIPKDSISEPVRYEF